MSTGPLERLARVFIAPSPPGRAPSARGDAVPPPRGAGIGGGDPAPPCPGAGVVPARVLPSSVAIVGDGPGVIAFAEACAGALVRRLGAAAGLLLVWQPAGHTPRAAGARPASGRLAGGLGRQGHEAVARGALATVALVPDDRQAAAEAVRARAAAGALPTVLVLAGPRGPGLDAALAEYDRIVVALAPGAPAALRRLAVAAAAVAAPDADVRDLAPPVVRGLPGVLAAAAYRRAVTVALGESRPAAVPEDVPGSVVGEGSASERTRSEAALRGSGLPRQPGLDRVRNGC